MKHSLTSLEDYEFSYVEDRPEKGMWHNGPNHFWITVTHKASQASVRAYGQNQNKTRDLAITMCEMLVSEQREQSCSFPERLAGKP